MINCPKIPSVHPRMCIKDKQYYRTKDVSHLIECIQIKPTRHHLFPLSRKDIPLATKRKFLVYIWDYKHFYGWNVLFRFTYSKKHGHKKRLELTIDEIITLMRRNDPFITQQVDSPAWRLVFKNKSLKQAVALLERVLLVKFRRKTQSYVNKYINNILPAFQKAA